MNPIDLLNRPDDEELTPAEEEFLIRHLAEAYRMDECAATDPDLKRLAEKVRLRLASDPGSGSPETGAPPQSPE